MKEYIIAYAVSFVIMIFITRSFATSAVLAIFLAVWAIWKSKQGSSNNISSDTRKGASNSKEQKERDDETVVYAAGTYRDSRGIHQVVIYARPYTATYSSGACTDEMFRRYPGCRDFAFTSGSDPMWVLRSRYNNAMFEEYR